MNGWEIFEHPLFREQVIKVVERVVAEKLKNPASYQDTAPWKLLTAIRKLAYEVIPQDPTRREYRQGVTLGADRKHWFRAKFGNQRFRLFFRYSLQAKVIIYAWINDENTLRAYGSSNDAYAVFVKMLNLGHPPDDFEDLKNQSLRIKLQKD